MQQRKKRILPILFSTPMVQALLAGRKTMTRRIIQPQPQTFNEKSIIAKCNFKNGNWCFKEKIENNPESYFITDLMKSKADVGDVVWVRETWANNFEGNIALGQNKYVYRADGKAETDFWRPSIFMPKAAARIFLEITNIKIERLNAISEADAIAEGIETMEGDFNYKNYLFPLGNDWYYPNAPKMSFMTLWQKINGLQSWYENPFVWVYSFKIVDRPNDFLTV